MANESMYLVTIISNNLTGTTTIPFTSIFDRDYFSSSFFETGSDDLIALGVVEGSIQFDTGIEKFYSSSSNIDNIAVINDSVRGFTIILRDEILFSYSLNSVLMEPTSFNFIVNAFVQAADATESRVPFLEGYVEIVPLGKKNHIF